MPHVLMLTPYLPYPPVSGGRMRTYNLVKRLAADYTITLVCFGRPEERALDYTPMQAFCELIVMDRESSPGTLQAALMSLTSAEPITMRLYRTEAMRARLAAILADKPPDVIHVESFYMLQNLPDDCAVPVLLSEPAVEYKAWGQYARVAQPWYTRPGIALEALKMRIAEPRAWAAADLVGAMSGVDAQIIQRAAPEARTVMTPNGVDVDFFHIDAAVERESHSAVFMGDYKYFPNTDAVSYFATEIMPRIVVQRPDFHLMLLGKDPTPEIQALAGEHVTVTGMVEDTRPYLQRSAVFVCPIRTGSGTRFKLMEALASGCPVVSTTTGAEGLGAVDGEHMLIRDDPQGFAAAVLSLLDDPARGAAMGRVGRDWVVENHAWERSAALVRDADRALIGLV